MAGCCGSYFWTGLKLARGDRDVAAVQQEYIRRAPAGTPPIFRVTSVVEDQGERAVRPESVAAAVFGLIAALIALVLATQAIRRKIRRRPQPARRAAGRGGQPARPGPGSCPGHPVRHSRRGGAGGGGRRWPSHRWRRSGCCTASSRLPACRSTGWSSAQARPCSCSSCSGGGGAGLRRRAGAAPAARRGDRRWAAVTAKLGLPVAARAGVGFAFEPDPGGYSRPARSRHLRHGGGPGHPGGVAGVRGQSEQPGLASSAVRLGVGHRDARWLRLRQYPGRRRSARCWPATPTSPPGPVPSSPRSRSTATTSRSSPRPRTASARRC